MKYIALLLILVSCVSNPKRDAPVQKPYGEETVELATQMCQVFAAVSKQSKLVIALENYASYDFVGTQNSYAWYSEKLSGLDPVRPRLGVRGHVLHDLILPVANKLPGKFEFLVFPYNVDLAIPTACANVWNSHPDHSVIWLGYSQSGSIIQDIAPDKRVSILIFASTKPADQDALVKAISQ